MACKAVYAWTSTKLASFILLGLDSTHKMMYLIRAKIRYHCIEACSGENVSLVYQSIEKFGGSFDNRYVGYFQRVFFWFFFFSQSVTEIECKRSYKRTRLDVKHHLHGLLPERDHTIQTRQVEIVLDEALADFREVFVTWEGAEPGYPCKRRCGCRRSWMRGSCV